MPNVDHHKLTAAGVALLRYAGMSDADATLLAESLVETNLNGVDSHGIARLGHYLGRIRGGSINAKPNFKIAARDAGLAIIDADDGHGILASHAAMEHAIILAREHGTGLVSVKNSSHCGAVGLYSRRAVQAGMIGVSFTHSDSFVAPPAGRKAFLGTNPISIAVPSHTGSVCLDMSTSQLTLNFVMNARRTNTTLPSDCLDAAGNPTRNPHDAVTLLPLGGHKGFALGFMIEILCGAFVSQTMGPRMTKMYGDPTEKRKIGALLIAIDHGRLIDRERFKDNVQTLLEDHKTTNPGSVYPGEPEVLKKQQRTAEGVPLDEPLFLELNSLLQAAHLPALVAR